MSWSDLLSSYPSYKLEPGYTRTVGFGDKARETYVKAWQDPYYRGRKPNEDNDCDEKISAIIKRIK